MKCQKTKSKTIRNSFFAVCLLIGSSLVTQACGAPKPEPKTEFDLILHKKDLDTIIFEIRKELKKLKHDTAHYDNVIKVMLEVRNAFFDPSNDEHISKHAERMEHSYALWLNEIVNHPKYVCVKDKTGKLYAKLASMLLIFKKHTSTGNSLLNIKRCGGDLKAYEHLLPKHMQLGVLDYIKLLKKRLKQD